MASNKLPWIGVALALAACDRPSASAPTDPPAGSAPRPLVSASSALTASAPPETAPPPGPEVRLFDTPAEALRAVLAEAKPLVLAVGEAHAQKGTEGIDSSAKRFTRLFLPELKGRASDLLVELMMPATGCKQKAEAVREKQKVVTEKQAETNQNEYVVMGQEAKKVGVVPDLLRPTCADLEAIDKAGPDAIVVSLRTIARLTRDKAKELVDRNGKLGEEKIVVTYGGAIHNDVDPAKDRAEWSFGPELTAHAKGRYVELDMYVPEFIQDNETWRKQPWYAHFDKDRNPTKTTLFRLRPGSYVLVFPRTQK
jgi:hypothetical protein